MGKLMRVTRGQAFLVAVDIRKNSPTLGKYVGVIANEENMIQLWAPAEFARGFYAMSDIVDVQYKCTGLYNKQAESGIAWDDPKIGIEWPLLNKYDLLISEKDMKAQTLNDWLERTESENFQ